MTTLSTYLFKTASKPPAQQGQRLKHWMIANNSMVDGQVGMISAPASDKEVVLARRTKVLGEQPTNARRVRTYV